MTDETLIIGQDSITKCVVIEEHAPLPITGVQGNEMSNTILNLNCWHKLRSTDTHYYNVIPWTYSIFYFIFIIDK